ncbi:uncharacterized protein I303_102123 [Kwoniella dejecticola CBS 10117]|uniref:Uncharacterized protein n=1 Tax=Kwoniella dejecticola CBS 10117 TaxID=1296121 RepID=A0A1A6ABW0_9TREE|nr:uncharacterized protein I303_01736 [Kwoniella dejecticola CBS 10117]OBR87528.1 hypothetical protein I303_01736 [Kwoniella dejecticola CBS 10117]
MPMPSSYHPSATDALAELRVLLRPGVTGDNPRFTFFGHGPRAISRQEQREEEEEEALRQITDPRLLEFARREDFPTSLTTAEYREAAILVSRGSSKQEDAFIKLAIDRSLRTGTATQSEAENLTLTSNEAPSDSAAATRTRDWTMTYDPATNTYHFSNPVLSLGSIMRGVRQISTFAASQAANYAIASADNAVDSAIEGYYRQLRDRRREDNHDADSQDVEANSHA